jgi:HAD superfamily hydrolase (TIGR01509 family)
MLDAYQNNIPLKETVYDTLKALKGKGDSLNVLTASPHLTLDPCLKRLGVFDLFDNVWSCDDFEMTKSNPEIYKSVADKLKVNPCDIVFVDDNIKAISTAKSAGLKVFGVYDKSSKDYAEDIKKTADGYFLTLSGILEKKVNK